MADAKEVAERLTDNTREYLSGSRIDTWTLAALIKSQQTEIERLRAEKDDAWRLVKHWRERAHKAEAQMSDNRTENPAGENND